MTDTAGRKLKIFIDSSPPVHAILIFMASNGDISSATQCLRQIEGLLAKRQHRDAYRLAGQAAVRYGDDPCLLSYFGYLEALVDGKYRNGIDACIRAIAILQRKVLRGEDADESKLALLHLNLGRAYIAAEKKKDAIRTLNMGLKYDRRNRDLMTEIERLGIRKRIPVPFLKRSNPINEIIGRMLRKKRPLQNAS